MDEEVYEKAKEENLTKDEAEELLPAGRQVRLVCRRQNFVTLIC